MKNFLKKRSGAFIVALAVILLGTYFGAYRSLSVATGEIADGFSEGVTYTDDSGNTYLHKSIRSQLINRSEASINLASVADTFDEAEKEAQNLRTAYNELRSLIYNGGTPSELCAANKTLGSAFSELYAVLSALELDSRDANRIDEYRTEMEGAAGEIETSGYNESVREFNRSVLSVFPTNVLKNICFVEMPELFE